MLFYAYYNTALTMANSSSPTGAPYSSILPVCGCTAQREPIRLPRDTRDLLTP